MSSMGPKTYKCRDMVVKNEKNRTSGNKVVRDCAGRVRDCADEDRVGKRL